MSDGDELIIKSDSKPLRFFGNFDIEFIDILKKEKCYPRICQTAEDVVSH